MKLFVNDAALLSEMLAALDASGMESPSQSLVHQLAQSLQGMWAQHAGKHFACLKPAIFAYRRKLPSSLVWQFNTVGTVHSFLKRCTDVLCVEATAKLDKKLELLQLPATEALGDVSLEPAGASFPLPSLDSAEDETFHSKQIIGEWKPSTEAHCQSLRSGFAAETTGNDGESSS